MATKFFKVLNNKTGEKDIDAEQLATFAHYIGGKQFRFVVTRIGFVAEDTKVTHRNSGAGVCMVSYAAQQAALGDYAAAGKAALEQLIDRVGAERVRSVLTAAA